MSMYTRFRFNDQTFAQVVRNPRKAHGGFFLSGWVIRECYGPDGVLKSRTAGSNLIVNTGIEHIMDVAMSGLAATATWYVGLKDTGSPAAGDTMASHSGWATISPYSDATDPAWTEAGISSKVITNSASPASFTCNATDTIFGAFLKDNNTVDSATGLLLGAEDFSASQAVTSGDTLNVTYQITGSSS